MIKRKIKIKCPICEKEFYFADELKKHDEKDHKYKCKINLHSTKNIKFSGVCCELGFKTPSLLCNHLKQHSGEEIKSLKCPYKGKSSVLFNVFIFFQVAYMSQSKPIYYLYMFLKDIKGIKRNNQMTDKALPTLARNYRVLNESQLLFCQQT